MVSANVLYCVDSAITTEHCVYLPVITYQKENEEFKFLSDFCKLPNKIGFIVY